MAIQSLLAALEERTLAREVGIPHDEARMRYALRSNTVRDFDAFEQVIADYYAYHHAQCVTKGGRMPRSEAAGFAKEILERYYRRQNGTLVTGYNNSHDGTNGGLREVLDIIADQIKQQSLENYIRHVFDRHVQHNSWEEKVAIMREFLHQCGPVLSDSIDRDQPERYAQDYTEIIRSYVENLRNTSSLLRQK
jgi:hypothetical protein